MEQYKNVTVRIINGCKVISKTVMLSEEEENKKLSEIKQMFLELAKQAKEKTA